MLYKVVNVMQYVYKVVNVMQYAHTSSINPKIANCYNGTMIN